MNECPCCAADLQRGTHRKENRTDGGSGGKSLGDELVACPECGGVIDGFTAH
jgi:hypothetical protein